MQTAFLPEQLCGDRVLLRRPSTADIDDLFSIYSDTSVAHWLTWPVYTDKDKLAEDVEHYEERWHRGEEYYWVIELTETSSVVGSIACGISGKDADIGFMVNADFQGHGYATEAARRLLDALTSSDKIDRVVALSAVGNVGSVAVLERIGMQHRGIAPAFVVCPNISDQPRDAIIYSIDCKN